MIVGEIKNQIDGIWNDFWWAAFPIRSASWSRSSIFRCSSSLWRFGRREAQSGEVKQQRHSANENPSAWRPISDIGPVGRVEWLF